MALFAVNSGCCDSEICNLCREWEQEVPELGTSVLIIPGSEVKNNDNRLVVLIKIAGSVVKARRGEHPTHVFSFRGKPIDHMSNSGWRRSRVKAGLPQVRVHDLKYTFGRRLRAAGVMLEDRQELLGH
jgi:integrase